MKKALIIFGCFVLVIVFFSALGEKRNSKKEQTEEVKEEVKEEVVIQLYDKFYGNGWKDDINEDFTKISKALVSHNIKGCGEMYYTEAQKDEYVVACSRDGVNFEYYDVWPRIDEVGKLKDGYNGFVVLKQPWEGRKKVEIKTK